ncbi:hypothetical protein D9M73_278080 [compost metagenome]
MIRLSITLEEARTRGLNRRRQSSMPPPIAVSTPATPPKTMAMSCLLPADMNGAYTQWGVSRPTRWPKKIARIPMWNRLLARRMCLVESIWLEPVFQVYWP